MLVSELIESLEDLDPNLEISIALQPNYPMKGSLLNVAVEKDKDDNDVAAWLAVSDNEDYGVPSGVWEDGVLYPDDDDDEEED